MSEAALYIGWGTPTRGREKKALDVFNESVQYYGRLQQEGKVANFEVAILNPTGGDVGGFFLIRSRHNRWTRFAATMNSKSSSTVCN